MEVDSAVQSLSASAFTRLSVLPHRGGYFLLFYLQFIVYVGVVMSSCQ